MIDSSSSDQEHSNTATSNSAVSFYFQKCIRNTTDGWRAGESEVARGKGGKSPYRQFVEMSEERREGNVVCEVMRVRMGLQCTGHRNWSLLLGVSSLNQGVEHEKTHVTTVGRGRDSTQQNSNSSQCALAVASYSCNATRIHIKTHILYSQY